MEMVVGHPSNTCEDTTNPTSSNSSGDDRVLDAVVDLVSGSLCHAWPGGVFVYLSIYLMAGGRLLLMEMIAGDQHVIRLLHHIGVVLQVVTLDILASPPPLPTPLDNDSNDHNDNDDHNDSTHTANDDGPLHLITGQSVNINPGQRLFITRSSLNNIFSL